MINPQKGPTGRNYLSGTQITEYCVCGSRTSDSLQINLIYGVNPCSYVGCSSVRKQIPGSPETRSFISVLTTVHQWTVSQNIRILFIPSKSPDSRFVLILCLYLRVGTLSSLFLSDFSPNFCKYSSLTIRSICSTHILLFL
jgi:hypothetical protein